jgi:FKBP-type peptidyl-prolyl cis-trans isomerase
MWTWVTSHIYLSLGLKFLEKKAKEEGVVTLPSGLLYKELRAGNRE